MTNRYRSWGRFVALTLSSTSLAACGDDDTGDDGAGTAATATAGTNGGDDDNGGDQSASATNGGGGTTRGDDSASATAGTATTGTTADSASATAAATTAATAATAATATAATMGSDTGTGSGETMGTTAGSDTAATTGNSQLPELCEAPGDLTPCDADSDDPFHAMGLNCPGGPNQVIPIINESFWSEDPAAWKVARQFGTAVDGSGEPMWGPREGEKFLIISSGTVTEPDDMGVITQAPGFTQTGGGSSIGNPDDKALPAPMSPQNGSNNGSGGTPFVQCDGVNDCSDSILTQWQAGNEEANDLLWFQFETLVPNGTYGFSFDFAYFSAEFPEWVDSSFNDVFLVWSNSESYTGNLCFVNDQPCTVTALWPVQHDQNDPALVGTGFDTVGGGTGWYQAKGSAVPGELLQLTWAVFDMGDSVLDTAVIIDNFQWDCEGCAPSEVDPCIGIDPV